MLRSQRRRRRRIKRPNIINSLKRKAGQVIDPTQYFPVPIPPFPSSPLPPLSPLSHLSPVRDISKKFNPTKRRNHSTSRANSNSSQGSMGDFSKIAARAFPGKTQEEIRAFVENVTENNTDFANRVTNQTKFREAVNKALSKKSRVERREFEELVTSKRTTPRRQVPRHEKIPTRMRRRMLNAAGKKSRKRRK
jgi:hypothetical protein